MRLVDFVIELLIQLFVELILDGLGELLFKTPFRRVGRALGSNAARYTLGAIAGFGFGVFWGAHLSGNETWPKLLWVSLALAAVAGLAAVVRRSNPLLSPPHRDVWRDVLVPPWEWQVERLVGFMVLNLAIAAGIATSFTPAG